jgi:AMMECR1 domain-containing protein
VTAISDDELIETLRHGVDGILLEAGARRATFLPAVWEQVTDARAFVRALKQKADWPAQQWPAGARAWR